jgi:hypothetical protein
MLLVGIAVVKAEDGVGVADVDCQEHWTSSPTVDDARLPPAPAVFAYRVWKMALTERS